MQKFLLSLLLVSGFVSLRAQITVSGTVLDSSKMNYVENVRVISTGGMFSVTDSLGRYSILVQERDSIYFYYNNKPTQKFPVVKIPNLRQFDISLRLTVKGKYSVLKEVMVFSKTHREDSLENRESYRDIFDYTKPGIQTSIVPGGGVGADVNELINIFRFKRNKRLRLFQERLEVQEQEKYVDYRFNKNFVKRLTGLAVPSLDTFMVWYRPSYIFTKTSDELTFNQYILTCYYEFQKLSRLFIKKNDE
ncbi:MAG TPA: hypothetical protein VK498_14115 [Ferruginibacter sp.]|nr:hypothetical protein [Ferruginibacter sp.]